MPVKIQGLNVKMVLIFLGVLFLKVYTVRAALHADWLVVFDPLGWAIAAVFMYMLDPHYVPPQFRMLAALMGGGAATGSADSSQTTVTTTPDTTTVTETTESATVAPTAPDNAATTQ